MCFSFSDIYIFILTTFNLNKLSVSFEKVATFVVKILFQKMHKLNFIYMVLYLL